MSVRKNSVLFFIVVVVAGLGVWIVNGRNDSVPVGPQEVKSVDLPDVRRGTSKSQIPHHVQGDGFVSADNCRQCHAEYYESWHRTYHRRMTQIASSESVVGDFDDVKLASRGREYHLERDADNYWVTMADPAVEERLMVQGFDLQAVDADKVPTVKRQIVMTTGSHHMQGYWIPDQSSTLMRQIPWYFLIAEKRWIPREDAFIEPPGSSRHLMAWNDNCISCHAVGGKPRVTAMDFTPMGGIPRVLDTQVADFGIACEACHGPGESHIAWRAQQAGTAVDSSLDPIVNPKECDSRVSSQICGQCHSAFKPTDARLFLERGYSYRAGEDLSQSHELLTFEESRSSRENFVALSYYWDDGACRVGGREYLGLIESPCFQRGTLSCLSCHSMHDSDPNAQLAKQMEGNAACIQCHQEFQTTLEDHTHHPATSSGSLCYNCHMPHTSYALFRGIRSHRIDSPGVATEVRTGRPNACNLCHLDRTLQWTADNLEKWYGTEKPKLDADQKSIAASLLTLLKGDAVQRIVVAWHMGWTVALEASGNMWQVRFLSELLNDEYSPVRFVAGEAIRVHPGMKNVWYDFVAPVDERLRSRQVFVDFWRRKSIHEKLTPQTLPPLLMDANTGEVQEKIIKRLLRLRNNRPLQFPE